MSYIRAITIVALLMVIVPLASAGVIENSFPIPAGEVEVPIGGSSAWYVNIAGVPAGAVITKVEAKFEYTAYGVVQNYVAARFNRGSDPGYAGGQTLVYQGTLLSGQPGSTSYKTFNTWNGQSVNTNYYFRFMLDGGSPYTCTIHGIFVRVTYQEVTADPPILTAPDHLAVFNRNTTSTINFQWTPVSGATSYNINVFPPNQSSVFNPTTGSLSYSHSSSAFPNGDYVAQVRALVGGSWTDWSDEHYFIVDVPPAPPPLTSPADGFVIPYDTTQSFHWNPSPDSPIERYYIRIVQGTDLNATPIFDAEVSNTVAGFSFDYDPSGIYTWGVRAIKDTPSGYDDLAYESTIGWGGYNTRTVYYNSVAPDPPQPWIPGNWNVYGRDSVGSIWFGWAENPEAIEYQLVVYPSDGQNPPPYDELITPNQIEVLVDAAWPTGEYFWHVRVRTAAGWSAYSTERRFFLDVPPPAPTITAPPDGSVYSPDGSATFEWTGPAGETLARYYFRMVPGLDFNATPVYDHEPASSGMSLTFDGGTYPNGEYTWGVRAIKVTPTGYPESTYENRVGWGPYDTRLLSINAPGFALTGPGDGVIVSTPDFDFTWENVGATKYELWVDDNIGFTTPEIRPLGPNFGNIVTAYQPMEGNFLPEGTWHWYVKAIMPSGPDLTSAPQSFTYIPPEIEDPDWVPMYRLYKSSEKDHFYCTGENHQGGALQIGYNEEGVEGHVSYWPFAGPNMVPLYRFWHYDFDGGHYYAAGDVARETALSNPDFLYEGITGYAYNAPLPGLLPLYHLRKDNVDGTNRRDNFYTINEVERQNAVSVYGFTDLGPICWISPVPNLASMPWSPYTLLAGLGVNPDNGNLQHTQKTDFDIPGIGLPLRFSHQYNSRAIYFPDPVQPLGPGWSHDYSSCITEAGGLLYVTWAGGGVHVYDQATGVCQVEGVYGDLNVVSSDRITIKKKSQITYTFDRLEPGMSFLLKEIEDRNGNTLTCTYEYVGPGEYRIDLVTGPAGRQLDFGYSVTPGQELLITSVTDPVARAIAFTYDPVTHDLVSYTDPEGKVTTYEYDPNFVHEHQLKYVLLPDGTEIDNTYAGRKLASQTWGGQAGGMSFVYNGNVTDITYLNSNRSTSLTFLPGSNALQPRLPTEIDRGGDITTLDYDHAAHPALVSSMTDPRGNSHYFFYDSKGNTTEESHPHGANTQYTYDTFNNVTQVNDPESQDTNYGYDGNGNLTSITNPEGETSSLARDSRGQLTQVTAPGGGITAFSYDGYGNLTRITDPLLHQVNMTVDDVGRVTQVANALGNSTNYVVDDRGLVTRVTDAMGGIMNVGYDHNGEMTSASGPGSASTSWSYNDGLLSSYSTPSYTTSYSYNGDGTLAQRQRPLGDTGYQYDEAGRLETITGGSMAILSRDAAGNITSVGDDLFNISFAYDNLNRVTSTTDHWGNVVEFAYDRVGNTTRITYAPGKEVNYAYDSANRLETVTDWNGRVTRYTYHNTGAVAQVDYPNGTYASMAYDAATRLVSLHNSGSAQGVIASYAFTLDALGNQAGITATEPLGTPEMVSLSSNNSYNPMAQITSDGSTSYGYDANGNLSSMSGDRSLSLTFDQENRLTSYSGEASGQFLYDAFGNRRQAIRNGTTTRYVLDIRGMSRVLYETDASGTPTNYYIYGLGLVSRVKPDNTTHFYHGNNVGSVVAMTDINAIVTHKYSYDPFGRLLEEVEADANPFTFVGQYGVMREDAGLYFMRARYYDSHVGRFLGEDPVWHSNFYAYAGGNPLSAIDPNGLAPKWLEETGHFTWHVVTLGYGSRDHVDENVKKGSRYGAAVGKDVFAVLAPPLAAIWMAGDAAAASVELGKGNPGDLQEIVAKQGIQFTAKQAGSKHGIPGLNTFWELVPDMWDWYYRTRIYEPVHR